MTNNQHTAIAIVISILVFTLIITIIIGMLVFTTINKVLEIPAASSNISIESLEFSSESGNLSLSNVSIEANSKLIDIFLIALGDS